VNSPGSPAACAHAAAEARQASTPDPDRSRARTIALVLALLAFALPIWMHRQYANGEAICYQSDAAQLHYPRYRMLHDSLRGGEFPLWQTLLYGGSQFHANPENPTLYPPVLALAAWLPPAAAMNAANLLHLGLAGLGMHLLVRALWGRTGLPQTLADPCALIGGLAFALSFWVRKDTLGLVGYGHAHALVPWVLWLIERVLASARPARAAAGLAFAVAALVATGGLYVIAYGLLAAGLWALAALIAGFGAARRRVGWLALAAVLAGGMLLAKLLPYHEWLPLTNRVGRLPIAEAREMTLGGPEGRFAWDQAWFRLATWTGGFWLLVPPLFALPLVRRRVVVVPLALALFGFAVTLGGEAWELLYAYVPPFDQIRTTVRAWVITNACLPILTACGCGWLLARVRVVREQRLAAALAGGALALALVPLSMHSGRFAEMLSAPFHVSELSRAYPRWSEAARRSGSEWRAADFERAQPDGRNEQFASSLFGVETVAGYLGHVWDPRQARHLYEGAPGQPIEREQRERRLGVLSVRWLLADPPGTELERGDARLDPPRIERSALLENAHARPRAFEPARVLGVVGSERETMLYRLIDWPALDLRSTSALDLGADEEPTRVELEALAALVVAERDPALVQRWRALARAADCPVFEPGELGALRDLLASASAPAAPATLEFERSRAGAAHVRGASSSRARWWVASEPWALDAGWELRIDGRLARARRADGVASAVLLEPGEHSVDARYRSPATRRGALLALPFALVALALLVWPARRGAA